MVTDTYHGTGVYWRTRGDTPGQEGRQGTHGAARESLAGDRGAVHFGAPIAKRSVLSPRSGRYQLRMQADIDRHAHGAFIADIRTQIGLRSEILVIGPI